LNRWSGFLVALEGGGSHSQAILMNSDGCLLQASRSTSVNTNFVSFELAQQAVVTAVKNVLQSAGIDGCEVRHFVTSLVGPAFGAETFAESCPQAICRSYREMRVVFAQGGIFDRPHGVGVVAATGATAWATRADDGRQVFLGGWGSLLGDEGSAYAVGLLGLRAAVKAFENRAPAPTRLVEAISQHFEIAVDDFHREIVRMAYQKPLSRTEIAGVAPVVTRLASQGDPMAERITAKVANDLADLGLNAARRIFLPSETFNVVVAGGLIQAGDLILAPFRQRLLDEFPKSVFKTGSEDPAVALGRLALHDIQEETC
jgi:N-acetylglucosamine kinase-like BadF-type ATPase